MARLIKWSGGGSFHRCSFLFSKVCANREGDSQLRRRSDQRRLGVDRGTLHLLQARLGVAGSFRGGLEIGRGQFHLQV